VEFGEAGKKGRKKFAQPGGNVMAATDILSGPLSHSEHRAQLRKAVIASTVGTTIEWYDFLLYSGVTGLVFGKVFFPQSDPLVGVLQAFAVYTVGFVARPIRAMIFGHYGDRIGRKAALIATLLITGLATFAVGFIPGYATIGIWGAVILTIIRFIQGVGVGGEWRGSVLLSMEWALGGQQGSYWRIWPCWCSARFPATSSWFGGGGFRFFLASSWSRSGFISGFASLKPLPSDAWSRRTGSNECRHSR
jgi:MFS family permease